MKRARLPSTVAAALLMAGAVIAAEEPAAGKEAPEQPEAKPAWSFSGQAVLYYQTVDGHGTGSLFDQGPASADEGWARATGGIQIGAENKSIVGGLGAGVQLSGLSALGLHHHFVSGPVQHAGGKTDG